ncbi:MAG: hypothetical protein MUE59_02680 [Thiobacillaceae bacterium]|jgi:hypothetical protein|nr:hypothetical protein [Thiobacillaceae bacterium]
MGKPLSTQPRQSCGAESATKRRPVTIEGGSGRLTPTPRPKHIKLATVQDVANELARLYRQTRAGRVPPADASRFAYMLNTLAGLIELGELERRVDSLERELNEP